MSIEIQTTTLTCGSAASVTELRRGRCWSCYSTWMQQRPVGRGATCVVCYERRRDNLRVMELWGRSMPVCHICAAHVVKAMPLPENLEGLRNKLRRNRRADDRRAPGPGMAARADTRIFPRERRVGDRREGPAGTQPDDGDVAIALTDFDDLIIEIGDGDIEELEPTLVRDMHAPR